MFNRRLSYWIVCAAVSALLLTASSLRSQEKLPDAPRPQNNAPVPQVSVPTPDTVTAEESPPLQQTRNRTQILALSTKETPDSRIRRRLRRDRKQIKTITAGPSTYGSRQRSG